MQEIKLTLEQECNCRIFESQVKGLTREQAQEALILLYRQTLAKETLYRDLLKQRWGIGDGGLGLG
jgi:hypothetical protein